MGGSSERLGVFSGGWTIEAAEAVCSDGQIPRDEVLPKLMQIVDKSLVVGESGSRYRFLDTIQKFAQEKLAERGGLEETSHRHLRYFADWAGSLDSQFHVISPLVFQNRTRVDLNNIRTALDWALHHREAFEDGVRLSIPASLIFLEHGLIRDEYANAQMFLRETSDPLLKGRLLLRTASLGSRIDQDDLVYEYCRRAEKIARELNERKLLADALQMIGNMDRNRGRLDEAEPSLTECLQIYRELNLPYELNQSLTALGNNYFYQGRRDIADAMMNEALELAERIGDDTGQGYALLVLAGHLDHIGKYAEAFATYQRALLLMRAGGDHSGVAHCLNCLSIESNHLGDYPASAKYALESMALFQSIGHTQYAYTNRMLAYALLHQGLPTRAHAHAMQSLNDNLNGGIGVLNCLTALAEIKLSRGDLEHAAKLYGYLAPRVKEKYAKVTPDSRSFERIGHALTGKDTETWQAEGTSMTLEEAVAIASHWTSSGSSRPKRRPTPKHLPKKKRSRH